VLQDMPLDESAVERLRIARAHRWALGGLSTAVQADIRHLDRTPNKAENVKPALCPAESKAMSVKPESGRGSTLYAEALVEDT